ncbi:MAG: hypothetical protein DDT32_02200 [Syntrophomonadaceae bacterium]|nr:hypothetical protein [Bacillota bacterium]
MGRVENYIRSGSPKVLALREERVKLLRGITAMEAEIAQLQRAFAERMRVPARTRVTVPRRLAVRPPAVRPPVLPSVEPTLRIPGVALGLGMGILLFVLHSSIDK